MKIEKAEYLAKLQDQKSFIKFEDIPKAYLSDREMRKALLRKNGQWLEKLIQNQSPWRTLFWLEYPIADDWALVLIAVQQDGSALQWASDRLQEEKEVVLAAVKQNGLALRASRLKKEDKEVVLAAVRQNGSALQWASGLREEKEVVLAAVKQNGLALQYASGLKEEKEVVLAAVKQNGLALQCASGFKEDKEVVLAAVKQNGLALQYASGLKEDKEVVMEALNQTKEAWQYVPYQLKKMWSNSSKNDVLITTQDSSPPSVTNFFSSKDMEECIKKIQDTTLPTEARKYFLNKLLKHPNISSEQLEKNGLKLEGIRTERHTLLQNEFKLK